MKNMIVSSIKKQFEKTIYNTFKKMIEKYNLITDGDRVAVEVASDKNNVLLVSCLMQYAKENPTVELEYFVAQEEAKDAEQVIEAFGIEQYTMVKENEAEDIYHLIGSKGCTKFAIPHNYNDVVNSTFMTLMEQKKVAKIEPKRNTEYAKNIECIRPICMVEDVDVKKWVESVGLPLVEKSTLFSNIAYMEEQVSIPTYKSECRYEFNIYERV